MKYMLDAMLFAIDDSVEENEFEEYISNLLEWGDWQNNHEEEIFMLSDIEECLYEENYYPVANIVKKLIKKFNIDYISYDSIDKTIRKLIKNSKKLDQCCKESVYCCSSIEFGNEENFEDRSDRFIKEFKDIIWYSFLFSLLNNEDENSYTVFTKSLSTILDINLKYEGIVNDAYIDENKLLQLTCKHNFKDYLRDIQTPFRLFKSARCKDEIKSAVSVSVYQSMNYDSLKEVTDNFDFRIQPSFYDDFCNNHYASRDSDLRSAILACVYTVTDQNLGLTHFVRQSIKGPQLVVNGYGAWRRNVTTSIKITYWKKGNQILFVNIGEHDEIEPSQDFSE